jgi:hypothetical protein
MKYKRRPYSHVVERKLEQLPGVDADHLWNDMHAILDKKMPQKKERRRFIAWLLTGKSLFLLGLASVVTLTGFSLFFLSAKENASVAIDNPPHLHKANKSGDNGTRISSHYVKQNITGVTSIYQTQKRKEKITASSTPATEGNINGNSFGAQQISKHTTSYTTKNPYSRRIQSFKYITKTDKKIKGEIVSPDVVAIHSTGEANFDITGDNSNSIQRGSLIATNKEQKDSSFQQQKGSAVNTAKMNTGARDKKGFYAGIVSGVDLSSIHFQSVKTGAVKGLIIGYNFSRKWSIESGLLWDKKRFYDDGRYFSPPGYTPTSGTRIVAVNGNSRLYEWPINVKYTIIPKKHSLFVTAGMSSYYMRSENYDYEYVQNNQPGGHNYLSYKNESKNWFSVANISIGYTHKLGDIGSVRLEPYLKLPFKNLGAGNMPIMSTGLNVGFTRTLSR